MIGLLTSLVAGVALLLLSERSEKISLYLVSKSVRCLPVQLQDQRLEQWSADVSDTNGSLWKLITALGVAWTCRLDILERILPVSFKKNFVVVEFPFVGNSPSTVMWRVDETNLCGFVVVEMILIKLEKEIGVEARTEAEEYIKRLKSERKPRQLDTRKSIKSDVAYLTNVPPIRVDIVLGIVDGQPQVLNRD